MIALITDRLELRPMRKADATPLMRVFGDARVMQAFGRGPFSRREMEAWVARNLEHQDRHGYGLFTVVLRQTGEVIGDCGLEQMGLKGAVEMELGFDMEAAHWGQGLATEAASAVAQDALARLRLPRLICIIRAGNDRSVRVAEKVGMVHERDLDRDGIVYRVYASGPPQACPTAEASPTR